MMRVTEAPDFSTLTTLRLGGRGLALLCPENREELAALPEVVRRFGGEVLPLGRGSNLLVRDGALPLVAVRPLDGEPLCLPLPDELALPGDEGVARVLVRVPASMPLPRLLAWCAARGLGDLTGLTGIPGWVGGAVGMNAGSYGCEIGHFVRELLVVGPGMGLRRLGHAELDFRYRHFAIPGHEDWAVIQEVSLALTPLGEGLGTGMRGQIRHGAGKALAAAMRATLAKKAATQPLRAASAGCVFANPDGFSAGKLLDEAGFRGRGLRPGSRLRFSEKHANFLVHEGGGTATEALELIATARDTVARMHGIALQMEVKVIPC